MAHHPEEYELQLFKTLPSDLIQEMRDDVKFCFENRIEELGKFLRKIPIEVLPVEEREEGLRQLSELVNKNRIEAFNKIQKHLLKNILKVPEHILLPEDDNQKVQYTLTEKQSILDEIEALKSEIKNEKYMEAQLTEELKEIESTLQIQEQHLEKVETHLPRSSADKLCEKIAYSQPLASSSPSNDKLSKFYKDEFVEGLTKDFLQI